MCRDVHRPRLRLQNHNGQGRAGPAGVLSFVLAGVPVYFRWKSRAAQAQAAAADGSRR